MSVILKIEVNAPILPSDGSHWIGAGAVLAGKVRLGLNVGIWFGAVLRGDNEPIEIGDNTNIQEQVIVHTDMGYPLTVGTGCTIGHRALLHGCTIGDNTLIGMGAMIMNGVVIGNNCLIGAGSLVTEGQIIPDGSLVFGSPARIKRHLTEDEIARNAASAEHYVRAMRRFREGIVQL